MMQPEQNEEVQHTATPWEARRQDDGSPLHGWAVVSLAAKQWPTHGAPKSITGWGCVTQSEGDARFIARACNSHDQLVAALERLRNRFKTLLAQSPVRDVAETLAEVDAALTAAKG